MPSVDERLAHLEGRQTEQSQLFAMIRDALASLDGRFDRVEQRVDRRFEAIDGRFAAVDGRFAAVDGRFDALENKLERHFRWTIGIQVTMFALILGGLVAMLTR